MRIDRNAVLESLQNIGITEYPRHVRYDGSEERFLIESSHPGLDKKRINGTRKGTIVGTCGEILLIQQLCSVSLTSFNGIKQ